MVSVSPTVAFHPSNHLISKVTPEPILVIVWLPSTHPIAILMYAMNRLVLYGPLTSLATS
uniref:Uncharacterized protein n=1 Tax=Arundo donax TaxID=35708 RepID=A0A0A9GDQ2_ARUDO